MNNIGKVVIVGVAALILIVVVVFIISKVAPEPVVETAPIGECLTHYLLPEAGAISYMWVTDVTDGEDIGNPGVVGIYEIRDDQLRVIVVFPDGSMLTVPVICAERREDELLYPIFGDAEVIEDIEEYLSG